ncbi:hypothetical protein [Vibrio vulnificus]|uniref:hypothetical protein n=1 Tax=Vibrio vulnificus TaxID=672 RepID=UPI0028B5BE8B|nr:hypothetical protein [Vibrio vulnificus]
MNNKYHRFERIPKSLINRIRLDLQLSDAPDALDVFELLTSLTHHNSFESKMIYQGHLGGVQRRLNKVIKPYGFRLRSCSVPIGIQRAHKVSSDERRWGFEVITARERVNQIIRKSPVGEMIAQEKRNKKNEEIRKWENAVSDVLQRLYSGEIDIGEVELIDTNDESLLNDFSKEVKNGQAPKIG